MSDEQTPSPSSQDEETDSKRTEESSISSSSSSDLAQKVDNAPTVGHQNWFRRLGWRIKAHKKITALLAVVFVAVILAAVPYTRYLIAGLFWKQDYQVKIIDSQTNKPVSRAQVRLGDTEVTTDKEGMAFFRQATGYTTLKVTKKYYQENSQRVLVPILAQKDAPHQVGLQATGRQVAIKVTNKISKAPIDNATIKAADTEATTNKKGETTIVLPADKKEVKATISAKGFLMARETIKVSTQSKAQSLALTPEGKVYFLSNKSGKIDVVQTNLDGSDRHIVVAGTGFEEQNATTLLASHDWHYLMLSAVREEGSPTRLYLIDTTTSKMRTIENDSSSRPVGWHDHYFVYTLTKDIQDWEDGKQTIYSYNADTGKKITLDQTKGSGDANITWLGQTFANFYLTSHAVVYTSAWQSELLSPHPATEGKMHSIRGVSFDGSNKKDYQKFDLAKYQPYFPATLYKPNKIYFAAVQRDSGQKEFYAYQDQAVTLVKNLSQDVFYKAYPTYLSSPSGSEVAWTEERDGKDALLVGNAEAGNEKEVASLSGYRAYGWFGNDYILLSKEGSELYILSKQGGEPLKIAGYYKPPVDFGGYGGQ